MDSIWHDLLLLVVLTANVACADIVYVTDLPAFISLAPCAASAVQYAINSLTFSECRPEVTSLESCACTKDQNPTQVSSGISSLVLESCGSTATEDLFSASVVFSNYCNQAENTTPPLPAPTNGVTEYITAFPAYSDLGPCAGSALSYVVQSLTEDKCPPVASALVSCACLKDQNSLAVSEAINSQVHESWYVVPALYLLKFLQTFQEPYL